MLWLEDISKFHRYLHGRRLVGSGAYEPCSIYSVHVGLRAVCADPAERIQRDGPYRSTLSGASPSFVRSALVCRWCVLRFRGIASARSRVVLEDRTGQCSFGCSRGAPRGPLTLLCSAARPAIPLAGNRPSLTCCVSAGNMGGTRAALGRSRVDIKAAQMEGREQANV